ncbi:MAG: hypothetical protein ACRC0L_08270 [Angustibacter sp.]
MHRITEATIGLALVMSVVAGILLVIVDDVAAQGNRERETRAEAVPICRVVAEQGLASAPALGWPPAAGSIPDSIGAMRAFAQRWDAAAAVAPSSIRPEVIAIATAGRQIADATAATSTVDDAANNARMASLSESTPVTGWLTTYCD